MTFLKNFLVGALSALGFIAGAVFIMRLALAYDLSGWAFTAIFGLYMVVVFGILWVITEIQLQREIKPHRPQPEGENPCQHLNRKSGAALR